MATLFLSLMQSVPYLLKVVLLAESMTFKPL
jgi:hypothetical protein